MCIRDRAAGDALSRVTITDPESEWERCTEKWAELQELAPVSYTHLDVYKRQTLK